MKRLLFDVNVILDVLLDRQPFVEGSSAAWAAVERGEAEGLLSAHAVTTLHYLNAKAVGVHEATATTEALLSVFDVAVIDGTVLRSALALHWADFEDAVTVAGARHAKCDAVITRNPRDFKRAPVKILTPAEAVSWLHASR